MIGLFRRYGAPYLPQTRSPLWDALAAAQHHGMRTRLMDWTTNPLVALYFAVRDGYSDDGVIYAAAGEGDIIKTGKDKPFEITRNMWFLPHHANPRIAAQGSIFSIQPNPLVPFDADGLIRHKIPGIHKPRFRVILNKWGFNQARLFPGLDGLADDLNRGVEGQLARIKLS